MAFVLSEINPVHEGPTYCSKKLFNIILSHMHISFASALFPHSALGVTAGFCVFVLSVWNFLFLLLCRRFQMSHMFLFWCSVILLYFRVSCDLFRPIFVFLPSVPQTLFSKSHFIRWSFLFASVCPSFAFCNFLSFVVSWCVTTLLFSFHVTSPSFLATIPFHFYRNFSLDFLCQSPSPSYHLPLNFLR